MYEVVVKINGVEVVVETVDNIVTASNITSFHREKGAEAHYRAKVNSPNVRKVA